MNPEGPIRRATSISTDSRTAVSELFKTLGGGKNSLVVFFCSPDYDRDELAHAFRETFGKTKVIGCTTAGEISTLGVGEGTLAAFALPADEFEVATSTVDNLSDFEYRNGEEVGRMLRKELCEQDQAADGTNTFAFLMIDGMSRCEERAAAAFHGSLGGIQLFGGSAGDGGAFDATYVYADGNFATDRAILTLVRTERLFYVFRTQHFVASDTRLVVTRSAPAERIVYEIDGEPAGMAYARLLSVPVNSLDANAFASHPVVVNMGGDNYVRSIMRMHEDLSIEFACAIDQGVVLRLAEGVDLVENLEQAFDQVHRKIGNPELVIGCDCLFRRVEANQKALTPRVSEILQANQVMGFTTYGEQFNAAHVNQTFTGVAIGQKRAA